MLGPSEGRKNINGTTVDVIEMQSEAGAAGAVHGSLSAGALTTTFTASQGLMLMLPNMHKIAGEMLPTVFYVTARSLAAQSLSIFGDHSDVMSARNTGWALIACNSVQEVMDLGLVAQLATMKTSIPFLVFFDGFRTSHELQKIEVIDYETMAELDDGDLIEAFRLRALTPDNPRMKVGQHAPDVYFQGRETSNLYYQKAPAIISETMKQVADKIGRSYNLFDGMFPQNLQHSHVHFRIAGHTGKRFNVVWNRENLHWSRIFLGRNGRKILRDQSFHSHRIKISHSDHSQVRRMIPIFIKAGKSLIRTMLYDFRFSYRFAIGIAGTFVKHLGKLFIATLPGTQAAAVFFHDYPTLFVDLFWIKANGMRPLTDDHHTLAQGFAIIGGNL
ncbi:MAG: hypothetical protein RBS43_11495 [Candidatus Cloacimonas sp.]|jgi:hypothetical protein|nr:hypothetical protein [Candidatus Cloacimonas sp.]